MGHLIQMANIISTRVIENCSLDQLLKQQVPEEEMTAWNTFIAGPIASINKTHEVCLVSVVVDLKKKALFHTYNNNFVTSRSEEIDIRNHLFANL